MKNKTEWFAAGGYVLQCGPFQSQVEAWHAMRLTKKEQQRQQSIHPVDTRVWPVEIARSKREK